MSKEHFQVFFEKSKTKDLYSDFQLKNFDQVVQTVFYESGGTFCFTKIGRVYSFIYFFYCERIVFEFWARVSGVVVKTAV